MELVAGLLVETLPGEGGVGDGQGDAAVQRLPAQRFRFFHAEDTLRRIEITLHITVNTEISSERTSATHATNQTKQIKRGCWRTAAQNGENNKSEIQIAN